MNDLKRVVRLETWDRDDAIEHSPEGIFVVAMSGMVLSWNPAMERTTGINADQAIGHTWSDLFGRSDGDVEERGEFHFCRPDGEVRWIRYTARPLDDDGFVVVARDASAEVVAERIRADIVSRVAHDLRGPLTPLRGYLSMLADDRLEESERAEVMDTLIRQVSRLEQLVEDLRASDWPRPIVIVEDASE